MTTDNLISVPTIDDGNSCYAIIGNPSTRCAYYATCQSSARPAAVCSSGVGRIWITPERLNDYLALKLVT